MEALKDIEMDEEVKGKVAEVLERELQSRLDQEVSGLKAKNDELIAEKRKAQEESESARARAKSDAEDKAKAENDYKQLFESQKQESDVLRKTIDKMNSDISRSKIDTEAAKLASVLTKDTSRAKLLQQQISQRLTLVDNEIRVADESGQLTVSSLDDLTNSIKQNFPFLVDGSQANGGGAVRAQSGAEARSKQMSRADFDSLRSTEKSEYMRSGGKLYDD
tara:strand:- start:57 stop:719 length:663 start_codon:yes stop_codon:yes gene_type:complete